MARRALDPKGRLEIEIHPEAWQRIETAARMVEGIVAKGKAVYGINTGFGKFAEVAISSDNLVELQENLIRSHAVGTDEALPRDIVALTWILRLNTLCRGNSGVRRSSVEHALRALDAGILAIVPSRGSVGASGDLAPSAHATLALLGEGEATRPHSQGFERVDAGLALRDAGLEPLKLAPKEGLSFINGTQLTTALALKGWAEGRALLDHANLACAMSVEGLRGSHRFALDPILRVRNHPGAVACGEAIRAWLGGETEILKSHENCGRVQDPYSIRCAPQVHGAIHDELVRAEEVIGREINSSTDNPLLFPEDGSSLSGGNFHAIYTARVSDSLASALTTLSVISERRIALAMAKESSQLPAFLTRNGGLNSGFMMAQVTAAALASEAKALSFPASVDSIPTSGDREDHVSMGPAAGLKLMQILRNVSGVIAVEIMTAAQALSLLHPLKSSPSIQSALATFRAKVPFLERDRFLGPDIEAAKSLIAEGVLLHRKE